MSSSCHKSDLTNFKATPTYFSTVPVYKYFNSLHWFYIALENYNKFLVPTKSEIMSSNSVYNIEKLVSEVNFGCKVIDKSS